MKNKRVKHKSVTIDMKKLAKVLNQHFGEPFLNKGMVRAEVGENGNLYLNIGRRDIELDKDLRVVSSGTCLC